MLMMHCELTNVEHVNLWSCVGGLEELKYLCYSILNRKKILVAPILSGILAPKQACTSQGRSLDYLL